MSYVLAVSSYLPLQSIIFSFPNGLKKFNTKNHQHGFSTTFSENHYIFYKCSKSTLEWLRVLISWKIFKTRKEKLNAWHPKVCTNIDNFLTQRLKRKMNLTMNHHLGLYTSCSRQILEVSWISGLKLVDYIQAAVDRYLK